MARLASQVVIPFKAGKTPTGDRNIYVIIWNSGRNSLQSGKDSNIFYSEYFGSHSID